MTTAASPYEVGDLVVVEAHWRQQGDVARRLLAAAEAGGFDHVVVETVPGLGYRVPPGLLAYLETAPTEPAPDPATDSPSPEPVTEPVTGNGAVPAPDAAPEPPAPPPGPDAPAEPPTEAQAAAKTAQTRSRSRRRA